MSRTCENIKYNGVITEIHNNHARVRILRPSACSSCEISRVCTRSESKEMIVDVALSSANKCFDVGDNVTVAIKADSAHMAGVYAFCLPLVCMLFSFLVVFKLLDSEIVAAVISVSSIAVYLGLLYLGRDRVARRLNIGIVDE